jgi:hypothetical protein
LTGFCDPERRLFFANHHPEIAVFDSVTRLCYPTDDFFTLAKVDVASSSLVTRSIRDGAPREAQIDKRDEKLFECLRVSAFLPIKRGVITVNLALQIVQAGRDDRRAPVRGLGFSAPTPELRFQNRPDRTSSSRRPENWI